MKCPICNVDLVMSERQGVEIDYCPKCRGVWLDRGELDKIIEHSNQAVGAQPVSQPQAQPQPQYAQTQYPPQQSYREDDRQYYDKHGYKKHKKGILGEIFDF